MATQLQRGDVRLFQTLDDGELTVNNGIVEMTQGLETMIYLVLFGGNIEDSGTAATENKQFWGNRLELDPVKHYRSQTQFILESLPPGVANLRQLEAAVKLDLNVFIAEGIANAVDAVATIPEFGLVHVMAQITALGQEQQFTFTQNWKAGAQ